MSASINWKKVPKQALVDALRNCSLGPTRLSAQDKGDLVAIARDAMRYDGLRESLTDKLRTEVAYRKGEAAVAEAFNA